MEKIILIYNPVAGNGDFSSYLDSFTHKFSQYHLIFHRTRANPQGELKKLLQKVSCQQSDFDKIVVAGGDGTVNRVVNLMMKQEIKIPLAIIPAGTVNDFASYLDMPTNFEHCFEKIARNNIQTIDVGWVNNRYFINVLVGGMFSKIPHKTETGFKNKLGRMAYYLNGLQEITSFNSIEIRITTGEEIIEEEVHLFLILNSQRGGGFKNISAQGVLDDGLFELILVRAGRVYEIVNLLIEFFQNRHLDNENILLFQGDYFKIEKISDDKTKTITDIDGEKGPNLPLEIKVIPGALDVVHG